MKNKKLLCGKRGIKMRISEKLGINKSRLELDFYDYEMERDNYAFLYPYYIAKKEDAFLTECNIHVETFFNRFLYLLKEDERAAYEIFAHLGEVNEICLGMSKNSPAGRGVGTINTKAIFKAIKESQAFQDGTAQNLEDIRLFIPGIDKDKVSDMVANIIKIPLIKYTQEQCILLGIPMISIETGYCWDKTKWVRGHNKTIVIGDKRYLLYPRNLVSNSRYYSSNEYFRMYILKYLQEKNIKEDTELVHKIYNKDGTIKKARVFKKDIEERIKASGVLITKDWLARFTKENPGVYEQFRRDTVNKISNSQYEEITQEEIIEVIDKLVYAIKTTPVGSTYATQYHHLISGILELLFYPYIAHPRVEQEIHEGRKRIDLVFDNIAEEGFFFLLGTTYDVPCSWIMVECKNYSKDISNPELDQMAGRFAARRGKFGIICCRALDDNDKFIERERDTVKDGRGWIIHLTDEEIIMLLEQKKRDINVNNFLIKKYSEIIV